MPARRTDLRPKKSTCVELWVRGKHARYVTRTDSGMIGHLVTGWLGSPLQGQLPSFMIEPFPTKRRCGTVGHGHARAMMPAEARARRDASALAKGVEERGRKEGRDSDGEQEQDAKSHLRSQARRTNATTGADDGRVTDSVLARACVFPVVGFFSHFL